MKNIRVLVTSAGTSAINVINALRQSKIFKFYIVSVDMDDLSPGLFFSDKHFKVPHLKDEKYFDILIDICNKEKIDYIFPLYSTEILEFSLNQDKFFKENIFFLIPEPDVVKLCTDKISFSLFLKKYKFSLPTIYNDDKYDYKFPLILKPRKEGTPKNIFKLDNYNDFLFYNKRYPNSIIQEFIVGDEYTVDCLICDNKICACVPRLRMKVKDGKCFVGKTILNKKIVDETVRLIKRIKINGPCNIQCIEEENSGDIKFIEVNPRLAAGGLSLTTKAGVNIPEMIIKYFVDGKINDKTLSYKYDIYMIRYLDSIFVKREGGKFFDI